MALPLIAREDVVPVDAVKRSVELVKRSWGESLIGNGGLGVVFGLIMVAAVVIASLLMFAAAAKKSIAAIVLAGMIIAAGLIVLVLIQSLLQGIYSVALFRYAESGQVSLGFDQGLLEQAFRNKK